MPIHQYAMPKPIGWYLREAEQLITIFFEQAFDKHCITRYHWMVLRTLAEKEPVNLKAFFTEVNYFSNLKELDGFIDNMRTRRWITAIEKDVYAFTELGRKRYDAIAHDYHIYLQHLMKGITDEDYHTTLQTLNKMIINLEESGLKPDEHQS